MHVDVGGRVDGAGMKSGGFAGAGCRDMPIGVSEVEARLQQSAPDPFDSAIEEVAGPGLLTALVDFQTRTLNNVGPSGPISPRTPSPGRCWHRRGRAGYHRGDPFDGSAVGVVAFA